MAVSEGLLPRSRAHRHDAPRSRRRVVRLANPNEAAVLSCLHGSLAQDACAFETCIDPDPTTSGAVVLVCEVSEAIAGYLCVGDPRLMVDADTPAPKRAVTLCCWRFRALGVAPQFRRTGVATDLWRASLNRLPGVITNVYGRVRADKPAAVSWCQAAGFTVEPNSCAHEVLIHADIAALRAAPQSSSDPHPRLPRLYGTAN